MSASITVLCQIAEALEVEPCFWPPSHAYRHARAPKEHLPSNVAPENKLPIFTKWYLLYIFSTRRMIMASRAYTPTEAAALSEIAVKSVHNAIDKRIIAAHFGRAGRELTVEDLLRLKLWYGVGSILSAER